MILVREISKSYGRVHAVRGVSLALATGQVAGLLGPNGAGKTTTIRMITGVLPPDSGSVSIDGHDMGAQSIRARRLIGYLPESAPLYPEMTPMGYLDYRGKLYGLDRRARRRAALTALDRCRVGAMARRRIGALSKGYRQRVGLAGAMLHDPPVLILDEPTNGLDPGQIRETRGLMRELAQDRTMLICSHILPEIERTCDRVIVMAGGVVRADGSPGDLTGGGGAPARYTLELRTNPSADASYAAARLAPVAGVGSIRPDDRQPDDTGAGWARLIIEARPGAGDLREALSGASADAGLFVRELTTRRRTLEEVFVNLVDEAQLPNAPGGET